MPLVHTSVALQHAMVGEQLWLVSAQTTDAAAVH
jgi:hypothetical protein